MKIKIMKMKKKLLDTKKKLMMMFGLVFLKINKKIDLVFILLFV
jgi:hypothetical protein